MVRRGECLLHEITEVKYPLIRQESQNYPTTLLCEMGQSFYLLCVEKRPAKLITVHGLHLSSKSSI